MGTIKSSIYRIIKKKVHPFQFEGFAFQDTIKIIQSLSGSQSS